MNELMAHGRALVWSVVSVSFTGSLLLPVSDARAAERYALVYSGPGVCAEDCAAGAAEAARVAGFTPVLVGAKALKEGATPQQVQKLFAGVEVWIQPGGFAVQSVTGMTASLRQAVKDFVKNGGGYVGFCAGAFAATAKVGDTTTNGFGIFPGQTKLYSYFQTTPNPGAPSMQKMLWQGRSRYVYFEGGPILQKVPQRSDVEIFATYDSGYAAAGRAEFGRGKVYVSGVHPEAPDWWAPSERLKDKDGSDVDLAAGMIESAAGIATW